MNQNILFLSIKSGDELVLTEMLFNGVFNDMTVAQCVAILSCFVINENVKEDVPKLAQELSGPYKIIQVFFFQTEIQLESTKLFFVF